MGERAAWLRHLQRSGKLGEGESPPEPKPAKYSNKKVVWEDQTFDSIREFERYQELLLLEAAGVIEDLRCQEIIKLTAGRAPVMSKKGRQYSYRVDFKYFDNELGRWRYEDVKGYNTPLSSLKIAMVEAESGIEVEIVR